MTLKIKNIIALAIPIVVSIGIYKSLNSVENDRESSRKEYTDWLYNHKYMKRQKLNSKEIKALPKKDRPDLAFELDFIKTADPKLKRPTKEILVDYLIDKQKEQNFQPKMANPGTESSPWEERGPLKVGGRTRALMFDPNDSEYNKVWAGGVSGGLWYNDSIYNVNSSWVNVSQFWDNIPISAITYDPLNTNVFYVGTGEGYGSASLGAGVWKTTDGGLTWNILPSTSNYKYIFDLVVTVEDGVSCLYVATGVEYYAGQNHGSNGVFKSTDGGLNFTATQLSSNQNINRIGDFEWSEVDSTLWASSSSNGRVYKLNKTTDKWDQVKNFGNSVARVEIAISKTDSNVIYALLERFGVVHGIQKSTDGGVTWVAKNEPNDPDSGIPADDFSRGQAWYDLTIEVSPTNDNIVMVGGINLHKTIDGGTNWTTLSTWFGTSSTYVHADQHNIVFKPNSLDTCLFTNDGGVFYSKSLGSNYPIFKNVNKNYNVTQFYATDLNEGDEYYLAGSQDNGTQKFEGSGIINTTEVTGGDGGYCFIDKQGDERYITSYVYNNYYQSVNGYSFGQFMDEETGLFINPAGYDDNLDVFYSTKSHNKINRYIFDGTDPNFELSEVTISGMTAHASTFTVSPYSLDSTHLFIGTLSGQIIKVLGANKENISRTFIEASNMPNGSVSSISLGESENEILVTFSNYGVKSVWYTSDGGDTWKDIESNLPNFPVRSSLINPYQNNRVILATELGIWRSDDIFADSVVWEQSNNGIQNVRVDMLKTRNDGRIAAATFGRGLFTSTFHGTQNPISSFTMSETELCVSNDLVLTNESTLFVDSVKWNISPNNFAISSGSETDTNELVVNFNTPGTYSIDLIAFNKNGMDTTTKVVTIASFVQPIINRNNDVLTSSETGDAYQWIKNGSDISGATNQSYTITSNGTYRVEVVNGDFCT